MCQIIALKTTLKKLNRIYNDEYLMLDIEDSLDLKGGDYYAGAVILEDEQLIVSENSVENIIKSILFFIDSKDKSPKYLEILFFSRQQPEMELGEVKEQPYIHSKHPGFILAVHGTVHNDKKLAAELNLNIGADTEIFQELMIPDWGLAEGSFAIIGINNNDHEIIKYSCGLEIWEKELMVNGRHLGSMVATCPMKFIESKTQDVYPVSLAYKENRKTLYVAFSGGMDIALSTYHAINYGNYNKVVLNYFAWGSKAEKSEISQLDKFIDFYSSVDLFQNITFEIDIIDAKEYFRSYFEINGATPPKIFSGNTSAHGSIEETESPLAYVPYRNTQFALLLASKAEANNITDVDFLFGLNLSEGMVFMDNSEGWLETVSKMVKFGAKDFRVSSGYNVIAPYFSRTKTNMIKEFKEEYPLDHLETLLELSVSCYYPNLDGTPCGKCGSCILRDKAINQ